MKMKQRYKIDSFFMVWRIAAGCLTGLVILIALLKIIPVFFGYQSFVVLSGSMEPTLPIGSVVYIDSHNKLPDVGDIAAYQVSESVRVTHRIVDVAEDGYIFQGDANSAPDFNTVSRQQIIGAYAFHIPILGYILSVFHGWMAVVTLIVLIVINIIPDVWIAYNKNRERN